MVDAAASHKSGELIDWFEHIKKPGVGRMKKIAQGRDRRRQRQLDAAERQFVSSNVWRAASASTRFISRALTSKLTDARTDLSTFTGKRGRIKPTAAEVAAIDEARLVRLRAGDYPR